MKLILLNSLLFLLTTSFSQQVKYNVTIKKNRGAFNFEYDSIMPISMQGVSEGEISKASCIFTWKDKKMGICNSNWKAVLANIYDKIKAQRSDYPCENSPWLLFLYDSNSDPVGFADSLGKIIAPKFYDECLFINQDSCNSGRKTYLLFDNSDDYLVRMNLMDLSKGKESAYFDKVVSFKNSFIFWDSIGWGVIDTNFNIILSGQAGTPHYFARNFEDNLSTIKLMENLPPFSNEASQYEWMDEKIVVIDPDKPSSQSTQKRYGLLNVETKKSIPYIYEDIFRKTEGNEVYFWCLKLEQDTIKHVERRTIDVLDESFTLLKNFIFPDLTKAEFQSIMSGSAMSLIDCDTWMMIFPDTLMNYGAVNARGDVLVLFEYTYGYACDKRMHPRRNLFQFTKDSLTGLFDEKGQTIIPVNYNQISFKYYDGHFSVEKNGLWTLIDSNSRIIHDSSSYLLVYRDQNKSSFTWYLEKNDSLFSYKNGNFTHLDSNQLKLLIPTSFNLPDKLVIFGDKCLVNRAGKIIASADNIRLMPGIYLLTKFNAIHANHRQHLTIIDESGNTLHKLDLDHWEPGNWNDSGYEFLNLYHRWQKIGRFNLKTRELLGP